MKIIALNGSPKASDSVTVMLIAQMERVLGESIETRQAVEFFREGMPESATAGLLKGDALLVAFPLYVDGLPAPLIEVLTRVEKAAASVENRPWVYAICNCGFYEAAHCRLALDMVRHFAVRVGCPWGGGIGIGCGGMLPMFKRDIARGPMAPVFAGMVDLCGAVGKLSALKENLLISPSFPRFLYRAIGDMNWRSMAAKNGVKRQLRARPFLKE